MNFVSTCGEPPQRLTSSMMDLQFSRLAAGLKCLRRVRARKQRPCARGHASLERTSTPQQMPQGGARARARRAPRHFQAENFPGLRGLAGSNAEGITRAVLTDIGFAPRPSEVLAAAPWAAGAPAAASRRARGVWRGRWTKLGAEMFHDTWTEVDPRRPQLGRCRQMLGRVRHQL